MLLSIVLPVKENVDEKLVKDFGSLLTEPYELLIQTEEGISNAVWRGIAKAKGDVIAVMDGDGTHHVEDLAAMLKLLDGNTDLIVGTRVYNNYPGWRRLITSISSWFAWNMLQIPCDDPMSAFFVGKKEVMHFHNTESCKFGLELMLNMPWERVKQYRLQPHEPVGKTHPRWREGPYLILHILRLRRT